MRVRVLADELVHVETAAGEAPVDAGALGITPMVAATGFAGPSALSHQEDSERVTLRTPRMVVTLSRADGCVGVSRPEGGPLLSRACAHEGDRPQKRLTFDAPRLRAAYGLGQNFQNPDTADGDLRGRVLDPGPFGNELRGFSGGANSVNQFPVIHAQLDGSDAFAVFLDNPYRQRWEVGARSWEVRAFGDALRYFVSAAPSLAANRRAYMRLTGTSPVPPRKAFGLWVSEFGYDSWDEVARVRAGLEEARIPFEGFVLDLQWFGGSFFGREGRMGTLRFDEREGAFPDAAATVARLASEGVGLMLIEESYVDAGLPEHAILARLGHLVRRCAGCAPSYLTANPWWGKGGMLDWSNPAAGDAWHDAKREPLIGMGVFGHWTDLGEPEMYDASGWYHGFPAEGLHAHADVHNLYALMWTEGIARGYRRNGHAKRPFILSRAGTSGVQRTGAALWSGDIGANLGALKAQANAQVQMTFSGVDHYGSDVGGFHRYSLDGGADALYTQWFAQSALFDLPLRPHAWNTDGSHRTSPAAIGHAPSNRANATERYRLFPYLYSLAHAAHELGDPPVAPPVLVFPDDPATTGLGHEKMLGPSLLAGFVADYAGTARSFYFPRGTWFGFRDGRRASDGAAWERSVPTVDARGILSAPLFAREGAIIPLLDAAVLDAPGDLLGSKGVTLRVFPATGDVRSEFLLREDDGASTAYASGAVARTLVESRSRGGAIASMGIGATQGSFAGMAPSRPVALEIATGGPGLSLRGVAVDGSPLARCDEPTASLLRETKEARTPARGAPPLEGVAPCYVATSRRSSRFVHAWLGRVPRVAGLSIAFEWEGAPSPRETSRAVLLSCDGARTSPGESIYAAGEHAALGGWDLSRAVRLEPVLYPRWARLVEGFSAGESSRWKCVKLRRSDRSLVEWQGGPDAFFRVEQGVFARPAEARF